MMEGAVSVAGGEAEDSQEEKQEKRSLRFRISWAGMGFRIGNNVLFAYQSKGRKGGGKKMSFFSTHFLECRKEMKNIPLYFPCWSWWYTRKSFFCLFIQQNGSGGKTSSFSILFFPIGVAWRGVCLDREGRTLRFFSIILISFQDMEVPFWSVSMLLSL